MAKKKYTQQTKKIEEWKNEVCDNCGLGKWANIQWNTDAEGRPITIRCQYYENGKFGLVRGTQACCHFIKKTCESYLYN